MENINGSASCTSTWDAETWLQKFKRQGADYRALRRDVWENTKDIVETGAYTLPNGDSVSISDKKTKRYSQFYYEPFRASFEKQNEPPEITVVADDCLDTAHKWVEEIKDFTEIAVLNMASRSNPGGGVTRGAGAQEEYLFRCSDYYKYLYRYASYASEYNVTRSHYQYPLDRNFGGIFSKAVTIFRKNEENGYALADKPWKVNMIAVAGMNSPQLVNINGEERIAPELVEGVMNKIRTILRIAADQGQKYLVLGALGCGAFHNPPKHVAELFRDVLCEEEFFGAFKKICFAVKTSHTSNGDTNFNAFKEALDGFVPVMKADPLGKIFELKVKKIAIARDCYALLLSNGQVRIVDIHTGKFRESRRFRKSVDIAAGFDHIIGLREDGKIVFKAVGGQAPNLDINLYGGTAVYACELHSAVLQRDGRVKGIDHSFFKKAKISKKSSLTELLIASQQYLSASSRDAEIPKYAGIIEEWQNIAQVALTFEEPYALTNDGKLILKNEELTEFQSSEHGKITQIAAWGCYYSSIIVAALYEDGTVKAKWEDTDVTEVADWKKVKKICCGGNGAVIGLTEDGKVLISGECKYKDRKNNEIDTLENITDIAANFEHLVALSRTGEIIYLRAS